VLINPNNSKERKSGDLHVNRLSREKSPYLRQHASNPVDWYPWCEEAFEKARRDSKPIFLSIGYSTCHWCHVMETESFEDEAVARLMNEHFVSIKVDREERPDIDNIYMTVCQMLTGGGGWPLTIVMTPEKLPFYAATYLPKESRYGMIGLMELIPRIADIWKNRRPEVMESAKEITETLKQTSNSTGGGALSQSIFASAFENFEQRFDRRFGGFGRAPKFPTPHNFMFLLRYWKKTGEPKALEIVEKTLESMRHGGIYDQIGYGFHRYSTDSEWLAPHFEKMLYDQALMAIANIEAYQATGREIFKKTACEIFEYVLRDMTSPDGGFYSAEDADSEGVEGKFYLWRESEIRDVLSQADADLAINIFNVSENGNFESHDGSQGKNILHLKKPIAELAQLIGMSELDLDNRVTDIRAMLFQARENRIHPYKDDKILTDWNGLMIAALALGAQVFADQRYSKAAAGAADFVLTNLRDVRGRLLHRFRDGEAAINGIVDDYAFMIWGLLNLYEATFEIRFLQNALDLTTLQIEHYWDSNSGGFFFTSDDGEVLPVRQKEIYDGAVPSGNSVSALNFIRLSKLTGKTEYANFALKVFALNSDQVRQMPQSFTMLLTALDFAFGPSYEIVIAGNPEKKDTGDMLKAIREKFTPNKVVILKNPDKSVPLQDFLSAYLSLDGKATAYICRNLSCELPTNDINQMLRILETTAR
jgi:uncharacterized protein